MRLSIKSIPVVLLIFWLALVSGCWSEPKGILFVKADGVEIMKEPTSNSPALDSLKRGDTVADLGKTSETIAEYEYKGQVYSAHWQYVKAKNGVKGWVCSALLAQINVNNWLKNQQYPRLLRYLHYQDGEITYGYIDTEGELVISPVYGRVADFSEGLGLVFKNEVGGYINEMNKYVIDPQFESAAPFFEGLACVKSGHLWGYIDRIGIFVIKPQYEACGNFSEGLAWVKMGGKYGYIDDKGQIVIEPYLDKAGDFQQGSALVLINGKQALIDQKGEFIIEPEIYEYEYFRDGLARVTIKNEATGDKTYGFIDKTGKIVVKPYFDRLQYFSEGMAVAGVSVNKDRELQYGYIDRTGKFVVPPRYEEAGQFQNSMAIVKDGDKHWNFIDKSGKIVKKTNYYIHIDSFNQGMVTVETKDGYGLINTKGELVIKSQDHQLGKFSEGLIAFKDPKNKWGYLDQTRKVVIAPQYDKATEFIGGMAVVGVNNSLYEEFGIINKTGQYLLKPKYHRIQPLQNGLFITEYSVYYGLLNKNLDVVLEKYRDIDCSPDGWVRAVDIGGDIVYLDQSGKKVLIPDSFYDPGIFSEGLVRVSFRNEEGFSALGYMDRSGKIIFQKTNFNNIVELSTVSDGLILAKTKKGPDGLSWERYGYLDRTGKWVIQPCYTQAGSFNNGLAPVRVRDGESGYCYINKQGQEVIPPRFSMARPFFEGYAWVNDKGKWGIIDTKGNYLLKPTFESYSGRGYIIEPDSDFYHGIAQFGNIYITNQGRMIRGLNEEAKINNHQDDGDEI